MQFHNFAKFDNFSLQVSIPTNKLSPYKTNELSIIFIPKSVRSSNKIRIQRFPRFDVEAVRGQRHRRKDLECRAWRKLSRRVLITRDQVVRHGYRGDISRRHWHNSLPSAIFFSLSLSSFLFLLSLSLSPSLPLFFHHRRCRRLCTYRKTNRLLIIHRVGGIVSKSPHLPYVYTMYTRV